MIRHDLSRSVLERLREVADIVQVVGDAVTLRKAGRNWVGLCPFHGEKTPSFSVSREKGTYYCFGCKRGGDVIDYVMAVERLSFAEAVERLAQRFGVELPAASPESRRRHEEGDHLREALEAAQASFSRRLGDDRPRAFLERRGVTLEAAADFGLGYAPQEWRALTEALQSKIPERFLLASGLVAQGEAGRIYDRFRDRVTIPIRSPRGELIGFGGRSVGDDMPKYLNSPETALFSKSRVLFALDRATRSFATTDRAIVVEGYFDCLALHRAGFTETVATLGTTLTEHHVRDLARKVKRVVVCFDGDSAGLSAARSAMRTLLAADIDTAVLLLPEGLDPDDLVRQEGAGGFERLLAAALDAGEFLAAQLGGDRQERRGNLLQMLEISDACPNPVRRFALRELLARRAGVPVEELGGMEPPRVIGTDREEDAFASSPGEWALLRALLFDLPVKRKLQLAELLAAAPFEHPLAASILDAASNLLRERGDASIPLLLNECDEPELRRALAAIEDGVPEVEVGRLSENLRSAWLRGWKRQRAELGAAIERAEAEGDSGRLLGLLEENKTLIQRRKSREALLEEIEALLGPDRVGDPPP
ncbi:MAG: DNA primase [Acidobacteriota bacterium]